MISSSPTNLRRRHRKNPLISDPKASLIAAPGAVEGGKTKRTHFVFTKGGKLVDKKVPVKPAGRYVAQLTEYSRFSEDDPLLLSAS
jgi:peroxiredoxin